MINYKQIIEFGLNEKEAKVFLVALELGGESVLAIAKKAKINRVATYEALENLTKHGLISSFIKGKRTYYTAVEPGHLSYIIEKERKLIEEKQKKLEQLLPELSSIYNFSNKKPKVTYYEGKSGVQAIQNSFLKVKDKTLRAIFFYDILRKVFTEKEMDDYGERRARAGIKVKSIAVIKDENIIIDQTKKSVDRAYIKYTDFPIKSDITIYENKIALISLTEMFGVVIENEELANTMKSFFDLALTIAQK